MCTYVSTGPSSRCLVLWCVAVGFNIASDYGISLQLRKRFVMVKVVFCTIFTRWPAVVYRGHRRNWSYCNLQRKKLRDLKPAADRGTGAREKVARSLRSRSTTKYLYRYRGSTNVKNLQTGPIFPYIIGSPIKKQAQQ
jgi:hypothetical protein